MLQACITALLASSVIVHAYRHTVQDSSATSISQSSHFKKEISSGERATRKNVSTTKTGGLDVTAQVLSNLQTLIPVKAEARDCTKVWLQWAYANYTAPGKQKLVNKGLPGYWSGKKTCGRIASELEQLLEVESFRPIIVNEYCDDAAMTFNKQYEAHSMVDFQQHCVGDQDDSFYIGEDTSGFEGAMRIKQWRAPVLRCAAVSNTDDPVSGYTMLQVSVMGLHLFLEIDFNNFDITSAIIDPGSSPIQAAILTKSGTTVLDGVLTLSMVVPLQRIYYQYTEHDYYDFTMAEEDAKRIDLGGVGSSKYARRSGTHLLTFPKLLDHIVNKFAWPKVAAKVSNKLTEKASGTLTQGLLAAVASPTAKAFFTKVGKITGRPDDCMTWM